jgi:hypothetical protein
MARYVTKPIRRDLYEVMKTACNTDKVNSCIEKLLRMVLGDQRFESELNYARLRLKLESARSKEEKYKILAEYADYVAKEYDRLVREYREIVESWKREVCEKLGVC